MIPPSLGAHRPPPAAQLRHRPHTTASHHLQQTPPRTQASTPSRRAPPACPPHTQLPTAPNTNPRPHPSPLLNPIDSPSHHLPHNNPNNSRRAHHSRTHHSLTPCLKIATHNVRGLLPTGDDPSKIAQLVKLWAVDLRLDILFLQETHLTSSSEGRAEIQLHLAAAHHQVAPYSPIWASSAAGHGGSAILVSHRLFSLGGFSWVNNSLVREDHGRFIGARCSWGGHKLALACLYGPSGTNHPSAQRSFLSSSFFPWLEQQGDASVVIGGDFNFALDGCLDRRTLRMGANASQPPSSSLSHGQSQNPSPSVHSAAAAAASRESGNSSERVTANIFSEAVSRYGLCDAFRTLHPSTRGYTYHHGSQASRIDRFHISQFLSPFLLQCTPAKIPHPRLSDHIPLLLKLLPATPPQQVQGPGPFRLKMGPMLGGPQREAMEELVQQCIQAFPPPPDELSLLAWWPAFKDEMARQLNSLSKVLRAAQRNNHRQGHNNSSLHFTTDQHHTPEHTLEQPHQTHQLEQLGHSQDSRPHTLNTALHAAATGSGQPHCQTLRHAWIHGGERPSPLLTSLLAPPPTSRLIPALQDGRGSLITDSHSMATIAATHYAHISKSPSCSPSSRQAILEAMTANCSPLHPSTAAAAGAPRITVDEVRYALKRTQRSKSPGPDGIPSELWSCCGEILAPILAAIFTAIGNTGCTPSGFTDGLVVPLHKAGNKAIIANYRPITLLNTDYRLLAKCLAHRWGPALAESIGPEQTAFMPGRLMGESILLLQLLPHALEAQQGREGSKEGLAAFLDFSKAYDTLDREFLFQAMQVGGASSINPQASSEEQQHTNHTGGAEQGQDGQPLWDGTAGADNCAKSSGMLGWARTLLGNTQAAAVVNGSISPFRSWEAGVRQGCPLAPAMYLFAAWALHCWLQNVREVGLLIGGRRICATQYADDCVPLLQACNAAHVEALKQAMEIFAQATGQRLNYQKSCLLPLGPLPATLPASLGGIPIRSQATTLGITYFNEAMQQREQAQQQNNQQGPHPHLLDLQHAHNTERGQLKASQREAMREMRARHDQTRQAQWEHFRVTRPPIRSEHQHLRQIEREEDADADLGNTLYAEERSLQRSHTQQLSALSQQQDLERRHTIDRLHSSPQQQPQPTQPDPWDSLLLSIDSKCSKLTRLSLSLCLWASFWGVWLRP